MYAGFWWGNVTERANLEDPGLDERILLRRIFGKLDGGCMDWIDLVQVRDRWRALGVAVMNIGFHKMQGISRLAENRLASQEGLCSTEQVSK